MNEDQEKKVLMSLLLQQTQAIRKKDVAGAIKNFDRNIILFDVVGLLQQKGSDSLKKRLEEWFSTFKEGAEVGFEVVDLNLNVAEDLALSHGFNHVRTLVKNGAPLDMYWRETLGWAKKDGEWKIIHAHSSVPFDAANGKASVGLKP